MTALQALRRYKGDLAGKTVFVPAGRTNSITPFSQLYSNKIPVSGTGLFACQLAKHVFKAGKVITTVSTSKIDKVSELLGEGIVDESKYPRFKTNNRNKQLISSSN
jgi:phosphopantothenoylcysteine synthetase/decarboxylase